MTLQTYYKSLISGDWKSGIAVFLVALPLCLGIALASGAPLMAGVLAGIVGGIIVSLLSSISLGQRGLIIIVLKCFLINVFFILFYFTDLRFQDFRKEKADFLADSPKKRVVLGLALLKQTI